MRSRAIWIAITLIASLASGACSGDGITIEVNRGSTAAKRVELYVVDGLCTTDEAGENPCPQLKTPSAMGYLDGEVYTRKDGHAFAAEVESDGVAYFKILSNGDRTRVPLVVAVGFGTNDTRVGVALMPYEVYTTDYQRVLLTLEPIVEDVVNGRPMSDGLRAEVWYEDAAVPDRIGCLALESTSGGTTDRKFIVPADDLDCDGFLAATECDSIWPNRGPDDDRNQLPFTCLVENSTSGSLGKRCILGDAPCIDGEGAPECKAVALGTSNTQWCVPSSLCDPLCKSQNNSACILNALKNPTMPPANHPSYAHCKVPVFVGPGGMHTVCRGEVDSIISTMWSIPLSTACSQFSIGPIGSTGLGPFTAIRTSPSGSNTLETEILQACDLTMRFAGDFPSTTLMTDAVPQHVLKLDLTNSMSIVLPLVVELQVFEEAACTTAQATCTLVTTNAAAGIDESLAACARF